MLHKLRVPNLSTATLSMLLVYLGSRLLFWLAGVSFDASSLSSSWQFLDVELLKNELLQSLYYLHSQPPAFNLFLGAVLEAFPENYSGVMHCFYMVCGVTIYVLTYRTLRLHRFGTAFSLLAATYFIVTPQAILYENWLFYTWPVATLLLVAAYALAVYERTLHLRYAVMFLLSVGVVCLTRATFHLVYLVACVGIVLVVRQPRRQRKVVAAVSLGVLSVVGGLFLKNLVLFGFFGSSSWLGMNLWKIVPKDQVDTLVAEGKLPPLVQLHPFTRISRYGKEYSVVPEEYRDIPAVSDETKSNGRPNLNHFGYIAISKEYRNAAVYVISHDVPAYLWRVGAAWLFYLRDSANYAFVGRNRRALGSYANLAPFVGPRYERKLTFRGTEYVDSIAWAIPVAMIATCIGGILAVARTRRARGESDLGLSFAFMVMTVWYVAIVVNSLELLENNRFRALTNPLLFVATFLSLRAIWGVLTARWRAAPDGSDRR